MLVVLLFPKGLVAEVDPEGIDATEEMFLRSVELGILKATEAFDVRSVGPRVFEVTEAFDVRRLTRCAVLRRANSRSFPSAKSSR